MEDATKTNCLELAKALKAEAAVSIKILGYPDKDSTQDWQAKLETSHSRACAIKEAVGEVSNKIAAVGQRKAHPEGKQIVIEITDDAGITAAEAEAAEVAKLTKGMQVVFVAKTRMSQTEAGGGSVLTILEGEVLDKPYAAEQVVRAWFGDASCAFTTRKRDGAKCCEPVKMLGSDVTVEVKKLLAEGQPVKAEAACFGKDTKLMVAGPKALVLELGSITEYNITFHTSPIGLNFEKDSIPLKVCNFAKDSKAQAKGVALNWEVKTVDGQDATALSHAAAFDLIKVQSQLLPKELSDISGKVFKVGNVIKAPEGEGTVTVAEDKITYEISGQTYSLDQAGLTEKNVEITKDSNGV
jgi:hypothetical protein